MESENQTPHESPHNLQAAEVAEASVAERIGQVIAVILFIALLPATVLLIVGIYPDDLPTKANPGFIDTIFASKIVIVASRVAVLFIAAYAVISVVGLIARRQFLTRVGPLQVSDSVARLDQEAEFLRSMLSDAQQTIDLLERRLADSDQELRDTRTDLQNLLAALGTMPDPSESDDA